MFSVLLLLLLFSLLLLLVLPVLQLLCCGLALHCAHLIKKRVGVLLLLLQLLQQQLK